MRRILRRDDGLVVIDLARVAIRLGSGDDGQRGQRPDPVGRKNGLGARALGGKEGNLSLFRAARRPTPASQRACEQRGCERCGIARCVTNVLLALSTIGISGVVGVAQLRRFQQTRRTWRLLFAVAALANSAGVLVILVLLLTGVYG